ncbi:MAG: LamG-like jellyroll fold domain-containing protein, partial [Roseimicrobium sp.]
NNNTVTSPAGISLAYGPGKSLVGAFRTTANRGDYDMDFGFANDTTIGILISSIAQLGRDDTATGGPATGTFYATSAVDVSGTYYFIPIHQAIAGSSIEVNYSTSYAFLPYTEFVGGIARNAANNGEISTLTGSSGLALNTHFTDIASPAGQYTLSLNSFSSGSITLTSNASQNGILLVTGAKNEDNYALSQANADGTFSIFCKDNDADAAGYENDPVGFSYLPTSAVGTNRLVAVGRINGNGTADVSGGTFTVTSGGNGQWYLTIPNHSQSTGTLIVSPEGGVANNRDNIVAAGWDAANNRWIIESRDLPAATLQNITGTEDVFSFAFFRVDNAAPTAAVTAPTASSFVAPAAFTIEAEAADANGSVAQVEFLRNGTVVATDNSAPYSFTEANVPIGVYSYVARATDNDGATGVSTPKVISVTFDPNNLPANTAVQFDGVNDYITMGAAPELNVGGPPPITGFTLECWFRKEGTGLTAGSGSGGVTAVPLFGKGRGESDGSNIDCNIFFGVTTGGILVADFESQATGLNHPVTGTNTPIANGTWHHAAVTFDGTTGTWLLYLDGVQVGTATVSVAGSVPRYDSIQHFGIGTAMNSSGATEGAFQGVIDEARVWNYKRSAAEIAAAKDHEIASATGLIGRFGLNEGYGASAASSAGTSVGTLTNGAYWVPGAPFAAANASPTVALTAPANNAASYMPYPVTFAADAALEAA